MHSELDILRRRKAIGASKRILTPPQIFLEYVLFYVGYAF
jgi:hypothetical protein